eukprot:SM000018S03729  [mRNA]  locus=s18:1132136:1133310:+ [translate_table: standard]
MTTRAPGLATPAALVALVWLARGPAHPAPAAAKHRQVALRDCGYPRGATPASEAHGKQLCGLPQSKRMYSALANLSHSVKVGSSRS